MKTAKSVCGNDSGCQPRMCVCVCVDNVNVKKNTKECSVIIASQHLTHLHLELDSK